MSAVGELLKAKDVCAYDCFMGVNSDDMCSTDWLIACAFACNNAHVQIHVLEA